MKRKRNIIWPAYIDATLTRRYGRRIPKNIAVPNPTIEEMEEAAKELKMKYIVEKGKKYPKTWFKSEGRIIIEEIGRKVDIIKKLALTISKIRNEKQKMRESEKGKGKK
ncbi:MAG: signal recognition particle subunit SRP19/SEC65 family protein [archaeon GBS-70-058]|nr:signal recognition particle subunit SRP19/SEC65 family protein [Candidatus Culexarchaeum nevadense]